MPQRIIPVYALVAEALMAAFQLLRPWGDATEEPVAMAEAFADPRWVIAHAAGAASFVAFAMLADAVVRSAGPHRRDVAARLGRVSAIAGAVLVLPYYGAETFALHEIGRAVVDGAPIDVVELSGSIRGNLVAVVLFGLGLMLVAVAGVCLAIVAVRAGMLAWATWPLGVLVALALPQFVLSPVGRMAYGVAVLVAAALFAVGWVRRGVGAPR